MPQLVPFYFLNQLSFVLFGLFVLIFLFSRYILPAFVELNVVRLYITKLNLIVCKYVHIVIINNKYILRIIPLVHIVH
ncbi:ATP synthase F0 subunit 8 (mitochondrion) [Malassezia restricta CBS 7877]|jgi:F-type H+-transporting ATPase subunit 8|uniref:ATP synthase protein 8 n=2 Tax=Malassezia restricta TaxID=76775 RepID=A0A3G2SBV3_MALR7|nr:ATP synthase F0 subunit 8 [Malassezia restricta]AUN28199.1 ATP synthase F0 subunit 8 [Malassezia restricta]AYO45042.1 ATP synthase F0 subunit 8 [Malassezia restricta CBS 7877]